MLLALGASGVRLSISAVNSNNEYYMTNYPDYRASCPHICDGVGWLLRIMLMARSASLLFRLSPQNFSILCLSGEECWSKYSEMFIVIIQGPTAGSSSMLTVGLSSNYWACYGRRTRLKSSTVRLNQWRDWDT